MVLAQSVWPRRNTQKAYRDRRGRVALPKQGTLLRQFFENRARANMPLPPLGWWRVQTPPTTEQLSCCAPCTEAPMDDGHEDSSKEWEESSPSSEVSSESSPRDVVHDLPKEDLLCPICQDLLVKPIVNACGHAFCFWCAPSSLLSALVQSHWSHHRPTGAPTALWTRSPARAARCAVPSWSTSRCPVPRSTSTLPPAFSMN